MSSVMVLLPWVTQGEVGGGGNRMYNTVEQLSKLYCSTLGVSMEGWTICRTNHVARILRNTAIEIWVTILPGSVVTEFPFQRNVFSMIRFFWSLYQTSMFPDIFEEYDCDTFTFLSKNCRFCDFLFALDYILWFCCTFIHHISCWLCNLKGK